MQAQSILEAKGNAVITTRPETVVAEAIGLMVREKIGALLVCEANQVIVGIVTERDLTRRVVAKGLDAKKTPITDIMTANPETLAPDDSAGDALELMQARHFRHLPVVEDGRCVGMVSIRDLYMAVKLSLEENIRETEAFVFGDRYGG